MFAGHVFTNTEVLLAFVAVALWAAGVCWLSVWTIRAVERLGDKAPPLLRWPVLAWKWMWAGLGAYMSIGLAREEIGEGRGGLGTGVVVAMLIVGTLRFVQAFERARHMQH